VRAEQKRNHHWLERGDAFCGFMASKNSSQFITHESYEHIDAIEAN
jgi:hypothetical protein